MTTLTVVASNLSRRVQELRVKLGRNQFSAIGTRDKAPILYNPEDKRGRRFVENLSRGSRALRVRPASEFLPRGSRESTDWYIDSECHETTRAHVVFLPGRNGAPRCYAATSDPWNADAFIVDFRTCYDTPEDTARAACREAELYAELCRESDMEFRAESEIDDSLATIAEARAEHSAMIGERDRIGDDTPNARAAMAKVCARARADVRKLARRVKLLRAEPWRVDERRYN